MMASFIAYACLVGLALTVAAAALERATSTRVLPRRAIWLVALALSVVWPLLVALARTAPGELAPTTLSPFVISVRPGQILIDRGAQQGAATLDIVVLLLWITTTAFFVMRLARAALAIGRHRADWRAAEVNGTAVRLSRDVGPAVVGLRHMDIVLPEWILAFDEPLRAVLLRHEEEHRSARDPYLLFGAAIATALMPWNPALWLQSRRLRLAVELDCDNRVLRAHPSLERYGLLLLTIAQRRSHAPLLLAPMLSESPSQLELRILAMRNTRRIAKFSAIAGAALVVAGVAFACSLRPDQSTSPTKPAGVASRSGFPTKEEQQVIPPIRLPVLPGAISAAPLPGNPVPRYPDALRVSHTEGTVVVQFVVDTGGRVDMPSMKVVRTSDTLFTAAVRATLPQVRFTPATVQGRHVRQLFQMPFVFSLSK